MKISKKKKIFLKSLWFWKNKLHVYRINFKDNDLQMNQFWWTISNPKIFNVFYQPCKALLQLVFA